MTKILAIDKNKEDLSVLKEMLSSSFPETVFISAISGHEGIQKAVTENPDVILLDLALPLSEGIETCKKLKADSLLKQIPLVIMTTGKKQSSDLVKAQKLVTEYFLSKPFEEADLSVLISSMVRMKKAKDQVKEQLEQLEMTVKERTKKLRKELEDRKKTENALKQSYGKLELSKLATLNLMEDLKTEIEEHKKSEEILRENQNKYKELFTLFRSISDNMTDMLWAKDLENKYIFANKAICDRLLNAINTEEPVGKNDLFFALREREKHSEDPAWHTFGEICRDSDQVIIDSGKAAQFDEYGNVKGKFLYLDVRKSPLYNDKGIMLGTVGSARDITHEKEVMRQHEESEKLLRESQIISGLGSYVLDIPSGRWRSSDVLNKVFGIDSTFDHSVEGWENLVHPDYQKEMRTYFSEEVLKKQIRFDKEYKIIRNNDKAERWVHGLGELEVDGHGQLVKMYGTIQDITEQKQIQDEIKKLNNELENRVFERTAQLEAANKELEAFSYSVSHDLRAPIRAIHGFTNILIEDYHSKLDEEGKRVCGVIQQNAVKMGQLVDDLLKFSQLNRTDIQFSAIDMKNLVSAVYSELTTQERRQEIDFQIEPLHLAWGDHTLIRQVWTNLISNALKFSSHCSNVKINISSNEQRGYAVYCIKDNGAGFDMKYIDKLFGVFQRLHSIKEFEGTGVGLAIVQRIIHRHGGNAWAEGEINKGAAFYFSLPIKTK